jgi:hypothetical protein
MKDLLLSLDSNTIKAVFCGEQSCGTLSEDVSQDLVKGSRIVDPEAFTEYLVDLTSPLLPKNKKPTGLYYLVSPDDVELLFLTVNKGDTDPQEQLVASAEERLQKSLEDYYFSFNKIAPFTYQFVAIRREFFESLLEVANIWGVPIKGVIPWPLLLPKSLDTAEPAIFISNQGDRQFVILSDLNGVYFASSYEKKADKKSLKELVSKLSIYNREAPIEKIYSLDSAFTIGASTYDTLPLLQQEDIYSLGEGFELHSVFLRAASADPSILDSSLNALSLLPLPEVKKHPVPVVPLVATLFMVGIIFGSYRLISAGITRPDPVMVGDPADVLGEVVDVPQPATEVPDVVVENPASEVPVKEDLVVRIENGSGVNGAAGRTQIYLEEEGYTVESIGTAPNQIEVTQILVDEAFQDLRDLLKEDLTDITADPVFDVLEELSSDSLEEGFEHNVLIILGQDSEI